MATANNTNATATLLALLPAKGTATSNAGVQHVVPVQATVAAWAKANPKQAATAASVALGHYGASNAPAAAQALGAYVLYVAWAGTPHAAWAAVGSALGMGSTPKGCAGNARRAYVVAMGKPGAAGSVATSHGKAARVAAALAKAAKA